MPYTLTGADVAKTLQNVIKDHFDNNVAEFARACNEVDGREGADYYSTIQKYLTRKSIPKLDTAAVLAQAAGMTLDDLAGIEKPAPVDQGRAERLTGATPPAEVVKKGKKSISEEDRPTQDTYEFLGGFFEVGGNKITIDLIVRGPQERARLGGYGEKGSEDDS